jgi:uncharacterized membrane protein
MAHLWLPFGIGLVAGMRSMTASVALSWTASLGQIGTGWIPAGVWPRGLATAAALAEIGEAAHYRAGMRL